MDWSRHALDLGSGLYGTKLSSKIERSHHIVINQISGIIFSGNIRYTNWNEQELDSEIIQTLFTGDEIKIRH